MKKSFKTAATTSQTHTITSTELFGSRREIVILHQDEQYRLRITNNNRLIMTK